MGIRFLTLRKRTRRLLDGIAAHADGEWRRVRLTNVGRAYRTPQILDRMVRINGYPGDIRQLAVRGLGHDNPTLLLTNQAGVPAGQLVDRYARRMVIKNAIAEAIDLFHMDALSAAVPMKVDLDLQLTLMAGTLYRLLAVRLGNGRQESRAHPVPGLRQGVGGNRRREGPHRRAHRAAGQQPVSAQRRLRRDRRRNPMARRSPAADPFRLKPAAKTVTSKKTVGNSG